MPQNILPQWMTGLEDEDVAFMRRFILASGSLKEMAKFYGVSYPTVRLRLDRLIEKISVEESAEQDPYIGLIRRMVIDEKIDLESAKVLISEYKKRRD